MVLPLDEVNHGLHVWLSWTVVSNSQCYAICAEASRHPLELERSRLGVLPDEVALCPCLQNHHHEEDQQRAHIDKQVFREIGLDYEVVLYKLGSTFQSRVWMEPNLVIYYKITGEARSDSEQ